MKKMTNKDVTQLGKDMFDAKIKVLLQHDFDVEDISRIFELPTSVVRTIVNRINSTETNN